MLHEQYLTARVYILYNNDMPDNLLIAPVLSPSGTVHFATLSQDATIFDLISALSCSDDVKNDILYGLPDLGWDIQKVRKEQPGRQWEESELEELDCGKRAT